MASTGGVFLVPDANFPKADWPLSSAVRIMIVLSIKCKGSARRTDVKRNSRASFFLKYSKAKNAAVAARRAQTLAKQNQACRAATEASPRRGPVGLKLFDLKHTVYAFEGRFHLRVYWIFTRQCNFHIAW